MWKTGIEPIRMSFIFFHIRIDFKDSEERTSRKTAFEV